MKMWNRTAFKKGFIFLFLSCFLLTACSAEGEEVKGEIDIKGNVVEVDSTENSILVEDTQKGLIWVALHESGEIKDYEIGQEAVVWVEGGIDTSSPASAKALHIEIIKPK